MHRVTLHGRSRLLRGRLRLPALDILRGHPEVLHQEPPRTRVRTELLEDRPEDSIPLPALLDQTLEPPDVEGHLARIVELGRRDIDPAEDIEEAAADLGRQVLRLGARSTVDERHSRSVRPEGKTRDGALFTGGVLHEKRPL